MFSYILSCKIRPREFIDHNIFTLVMNKVKVKLKKKKDKKTLIKEQ